MICKKKTYATMHKSSKETTLRAVERGTATHICPAITWSRSFSGLHFRPPLIHMIDLPWLSLPAPAYDENSSISAGDHSVCMQALAPTPPHTSSMLWMPNTSSDAIQFLYFSVAFSGLNLQFITHSVSSMGEILLGCMPPLSRRLFVS
jgi:hypothetical protein